MKNIIFIIHILTSAFLIAQESDAQQFSPPEGQALIGDTYGSGVSKKALKKAMSPDELAQKLQNTTEVENVSLKGKVIEVCKKKGCWLTIDTGNEEPIFVKMKDYSFFVPLALEGKEVVLEGNAEVQEVSVDELQHYARDAQKSEEEIASITEPGKEIRFRASGILVVD